MRLLRLLSKLARKMVHRPSLPSEEDATVGSLVKGGELMRKACPATSCFHRCPPWLCHPSRRLSSLIPCSGSSHVAEWGKDKGERRKGGETDIGVSHADSIGGPC
ncbi:Os07g0693050 [Oryza sativa Japonica Group]|uniref:Os07g0693050 protein n=2 Tax=Oryza sativa subsp. japonica TaxID=39947 RepID=Q84NQ0_ORYSJ|nr:hypothetical protein [Oryza sativa Japonica Group]BAT03353.1 Os07g0693050 [Oryza sativa Japonica Group]